MNFTQLLEQVIERGNLNEKESFFCMEEILSGKLPVAQIAAFLSALRSKGESVDEIVGFVKAMRGSMVKISSPTSIIADTCGTGGDGKGTFNISTAAAFVAAGAGVKVAKHGNRSVSSRCGSADVLEAAGVKIDMSKERAEECLNEIGITFLLAPLYHPAMKNAAQVRRELGVRTVFNLLGPLCNPASANLQVIGVPNKELVPKISEVLRKLNQKNGSCSWVVHESGYDELVLQGTSTVSEIFKNKIKKYSLSPQSFGLKKAGKKTLQGGDRSVNAMILKEVLSSNTSPLQDVVIANAALTIICAEKLKGKKISLKDAVHRARETLLSGRAYEKLEELIQRSHKN